jgi:hypothetical protein
MPVADAQATMTDAETHIYAFTSCHGDAYFGSFAELKDRAVIGPVRSSDRLWTNARQLIT